ncbi:protein-disulfide reductase DsbD domain-containing protein [Roseovarius sp. ZX-A-9]|uniref:protein-disulfide reductase DsbD domain-containing protein n=1 Tax=Roseovarius sp. ZX-A-9 TaxID=3014783 RepID=UPI00233023E7|nr:protein-disulfide reductase DsbD domain-containing protein [Roseovarius sp. ZX-A-9]MDX1785495.1 protein-disulfide reductase DsbD family protein [Roseovarius sp.]
MIQRLFHIFLTCAALLAPGLPVAAAGSLDDVLKARVLTGWRMADGTHMAGLEITLRPGWKTYWRAPGDLGIPPSFDWRGSGNLAGVEIQWPTPAALLQDGMTTIGYTGRVVFPLKVLPDRAGRDIRLQGALDLGVCEDVCIPVNLNISATLPRDAQRRDPAIAAALADRPYSATEARVGSVHCTLSPREGGLTLRADIRMPSAGGTEVAVIETDNPQVWVAPAKTTRNGGTLTAQTRLEHAEGRSFAVNRSALRITVLGTSYAVDIQGCPAG